MDGGSTDGTLEILQGYTDKRIRVFSGPDQGIYDAMNKGIAMATGDVVGILNADDFYPDIDKLAQVAGAFAHTTTDTCFGDLNYVDDRDKRRIVRRWQSGRFDRKRFYQGWMPPHPTFFVRRSCYENYGGFRLDMGTSADYELMLRFLLKHGLCATHIPDVLVHMRMGGESNARIQNRIRANRMDRKAWRINGLKPYPWTLFLKPLRKIIQFV